MVAPSSSVSIDAAVARLHAVQAAMDKAACAAARDPGAITLIAVSKTKPVEEIVPLIHAGQRHFGENRVQELKAKAPQLRDSMPGLMFHLIGPLQTNKVRDAVALADVIHSVDRPKLAGALADEMTRQGRRLPCFVQVNTGEETQKAGIPPQEAVAFVRACVETYGLDVQGLMAVPPQEENPALHFALLRTLAAEAGVSGLSMGMSADMEDAIHHGATHVRVGTALFGPRVNKG